MPNLLQETLEILSQNDKAEDDVLWVGDEGTKTTWQDFKEKANVDYNSLNIDDVVYNSLLIVGKDWWLERYSDDIYSSWDFKSQPKVPSDNAEIDSVFGDSWDNGFWK